MLNFYIPKFIKDNLGYILLGALALYGMNFIHDHGYNKRNNEIIAEQAAIDKARQEATVKTDKIIKETEKVIKEEFAVIKDELNTHAEAIALPVQPTIPKPPTVVTKPSPPKPVVVTTTTTSTQILPEPVIEREQVMEPPVEIVLAWRAYELALQKSGG